jgi:hypothetical protein
VIEALLAASDTLGAAVESDAFGRLLHEEALDPEPATRALLAHVSEAPDTSEKGPSSSAALVAELVGREREFATILDAWREARAGQPVIVRALGPPGLGKTRLLADVAARLRSTRARVVFVRANPGARDVPYALASELAGTLGELPGARAVSPVAIHVLVSLNPGLSAYFSSTEGSRVAPSDELRQRMHAVHELISAVADEQPIAVLIDDLHWADALSRQVLAGVCGLLKEDRILIVTAERGHAALDASLPQARLLQLMPLSPGAVNSLVLSLADLPSASWAERFPGALHTASGGSPLLVVETLHLLMQRELLMRNDASWRAPDPEALFRVLDEGAAIQFRIAQLADADRFVLSILSCAGTPLDEATIATACFLQPAGTVALLRALEGQALAMRSGDRWEVAHDEIASRLLDSLSGFERRARTGAVGRALLAQARDDARSLRFSAQYLRAARDDLALNDAFAQFVRLARLRRDPRRLPILAVDLLGESASSGDVRTLVAALPVRVRLGLDTRRRKLAFAAASLLVLIGLTATIVALRKPAPPPPDALLAVTFEDEAGLSIYEAHIDTTGWAPGTPITVNARGQPRWHFAATETDYVAPRPGDPGSWAVARPVADSGGYELFFLSRERGEQRLTFAPGGDIEPSWSPDGRHLVFATARWNALEHYDLARLDVGTQRVTQLTSGDPTDYDPSWSPDGTRIAFARKYWDGRANEICAMASDGSRLRCHSLAGGPLVLLGWLDQSVVLIGDSPDRHATVDVDSWVSARYVTVANAVLSPNGRWLLGSTGAAGAEVFWVFPTTMPSSRRRIVIDAPTRRSQMTLRWASTAENPRYLARLDLGAGPGHPRVGVTHVLRASGKDDLGSGMTLREVTYRSSDSTIAMIDSFGALHPLRTGVVVIKVSAGGWRRAEVRLPIEENRVATLFTQSWTAGFTKNWVPFGEPTAAIDTGPRGTPGLRNGGDGRFASGVHSTRAYDARAGLGVDAILSTPITRPQWQHQAVVLLAGTDSSRLFAWDHRTGNPWPHLGTGAVSCGIEYPSGPEGPSFGNQIGVNAPGAAATAAPSSLRSGAWYHLRLQIFPDGRCGIAINGMPIFVSAPSVSAPTAQVFLYGNSVGSKILVGPLALFSGVRTDIDWTGASPHRNGRRTPHATTVDTARAPANKRSD